MRKGQSRGEGPQLSKAARKAIDETNQRELDHQRDKAIDKRAAKVQSALDRAAKKTALPDLSGKLYGKDDE
jgi:hypothetical protein